MEDFQDSDNGYSINTGEPTRQHGDCVCSINKHV